jgi:hypothetical protein
MMRGVIYQRTTEMQFSVDVLCKLCSQIGGRGALGMAVHPTVVVATNGPPGRWGLLASVLAQ